MLPDRAADRARLESAASALGLALSQRQGDQLLAYRDLLLKWNAVYNLTAIRDADAAFGQHLVDCLAVVRPLDRVLEQRGLGRHEAARVLDVGTGGGLPGIVLGIVRPQWRIDCLDAVAKKVAFVRQAIAELGLRGVDAVHTRVESWSQRPQACAAYDVVISRAFASLADFVRSTAALPRPGGVWAAMKGRPPDDEIAALPPGVAVFHVEPLVLPGVDLQRCLVWIEKTVD